ncbi:MAG TPA: hypothetical protein VGN29_18790 [Solirubrobacteraceae bacterium]|nr:hypothetical protein [Solirubrobacteraceae bacterium]
MAGVPSGCGPSSKVSATPGPSVLIVRGMSNAAAADAETGASAWRITGG